MILFWACVALVAISSFIVYFSSIFLLANIALVCILNGVVDITSQVWGYLDSGKWEEWSAIDLLIKRNFPFSHWARKPNNLLGVHKILSSMNGGVASILIGFCFISTAFLLAAFPMRKEIRESIKKERLFNNLTDSIKNHPVVILLGIIASLLAIVGLFI